MTHMAQGVGSGTFAAGQTQVGIPVTGEQKGKADITVSLNGSSRSAKVSPGKRFNTSTTP